MTEDSYTAWDENQYEWPPPDGWYQAADAKWWPEGYGPPSDPTPVDPAPVDPSPVDPAPVGSTTVDGPGPVAGSDPAPGRLGDAAVARGPEGFSAAPSDSEATFTTTVGDLTGSSGGAGELASNVAGAAGVSADTAFGAAATDTATDAATDTATDTAVEALAGAEEATRRAASGLGDAASGAVGGVSGGDPSGGDPSGGVSGRVGSFAGRLRNAAGGIRGADRDEEAKDGPDSTSDVADQTIGGSERYGFGADARGLTPHSDSPNPGLGQSFPGSLDPAAEVSHPSEPAVADQGSGDDSGSKPFDPQTTAAFDLPTTDDFGGRPVASSAEAGIDQTWSPPTGAKSPVGSDAGRLPPPPAPGVQPTPSSFGGQPPRDDRMPIEAPVADVEASGRAGRNELLPPPGALDLDRPAGDRRPPGVAPDRRLPPVDPKPVNDPFGDNRRPSAPMADGLPPTSFPNDSVANDSTLGGFGDRSSLRPPPVVDERFGSPPPNAAGGQDPLLPTGPSFRPNGDAFDTPTDTPGAPGPESVTDWSPKSAGLSKTIVFVAIGVGVLVLLGILGFFVFGGGSDDEPLEEAEATTGPGSALEPHPRNVGVEVFYPDGDIDQQRWVIEVLEPVSDGSAEIAGDGSVEPPADGQAFATTRVRLRNKSGSDGASLADLNFNAVTASGEVIDRLTNQCSFSADDLNYTAVVPVEESVEGDLCWAIPEGDVDGLLLAIESTKVDGRVHISLQ